MANNKLLTLDDLYNYYSKSNKFEHFSNNDSPIVVQTTGKLKFEENNDTEGLFPVVLQANHTGVNVNKSKIEDDVQLKALPSIYNRPILGYIHEVNGQWEFYSHNMHLDDEDEIVYDEIPIGVIPESGNAELVYDEEKGKSYVNVNGYIYSEYTKAQEILEREKECSVSVEIAIRELSFDAKEKVLIIEDFYYMGITILGKTPDGIEVKPGMEGSNIKLSDFSKDNNSVFSNIDVNEKLVDTLEKLNNTLESFNIYSARKEDDQVEKEKFGEEVAEEVVEDTEEVTEENAEEVTDAEEQSEETSENTSDADEEQEDVIEESSEESEDAITFSKKVNKLENGNKEVSFEISHEDVRYALYSLIEQFEELDNEWYYIESVYDDYFVFSSWGGSVWGCKYSKDGDNVSLDGERYKLYRELLTESEKSELDSMRSNYATLQEKLNKYEKAESNKQKDAIFADETYAEYLEDEEFKSLMKNKDDYSVEELKDKAEIAFAKCVRKHGTFSAKEPEQKSKRNTLFSAKKVKDKNPYPTLFK